MKVSEKIKLIRKANNLTQEQFANSLGISRGNLANIEVGNVAPTTLLLNCVSLMYNVRKNWLLDENNNDLGELNNATDMQILITQKYEQLDDSYKEFVQNQIEQLLKMQESQSKEQK